jgi:hypothetical protein
MRFAFTIGTPRTPGSITGGIVASADGHRPGNPAIGPRFQRTLGKENRSREPEP